MAEDVPLDLVLNMKRQGLSPNQVVQTLQKNGYSQESILNALSQSEIKGTLDAMPHNMMEMPIPQNPMGMNPQSMNNPPMDPSNISTEELIEAIIDEKWNELLKDINKVIKWKDKTETKIVQMEQKMQDIKDEFDKLHQAIIGKIGEYDKHILDVGTEVQAMEKVFQKVLPTFVDNINELGRLTANIKQKVGSHEISNAPSKEHKEEPKKRNIFEDGSF